MALLISAVLAAVDQWVTFFAPGPEWALHHRSQLWFIGSCLLLAVLLPLARVPSWAVAVEAGVFGGGVLGNLVSAAANDHDIPNPLLLGSGSGPATFRGIAFNPADAFVLAGNLMLVATLIVLTIRNRDRLPREATLVRAFRRSLRGRGDRR